MGLPHMWQPALVARILARSRSRWLVLRPVLTVGSLGYADHMGKGVAMVPYVGGPWGGTTKGATYDEFGELQEYVRDVNGRPVYRLRFKSMIRGRGESRYEEPRYEYVGD